MFEIFLCLLLKILVYIHFCSAKEDVSNSGEHKVIELFPEIYDTYLQAVSKDEIAVTRRLFKNNNNYMLHIQKLKEVNGVKTHNIVVTKFLRSDEPLVYINNPIEARIPNAFLTQEQFKKHLMNNIRQQQQEFENQKIQKVLSQFKMKSKKHVKQGKKHVKKYSESNFNVASPKRVITKEPFLTRIPTTRTPTDNSRDIFIAMLNGETIPPSTISTIRRNTKKLNVPSIAKEPLVYVDFVNTVNNDSITSKENLSAITDNASKDTEANYSEKIATTDNSRDLLIAMLNGETIPPSTTSTTLKSTKKLTVPSIEKEPLVSVDITTDHYVFINTTIDTVDNHTITSEESLSETTDNISKDTEVNHSETIASTTTDVTSNERTANMRSDLVEDSSDITVSITTDTTSTETTTNIDDESLSATETTEATTPMISTELTSTETTTEPTSTQSTRSTRGRPFVFMGMD